MTAPPCLRWHVVHTQVHAEFKAQTNLTRQGFEVYLPRYLKSRRHARRVENVVAPLFARYLFVAFDAATQRWRSILSTFGVSGLVQVGDRPAEVSSRVIDELKARENASGVICLASRPAFNVGDKIRIADGVFASSLGLYEGMSSEERVTVLLDLLGRKVKVALDAGLVMAV